MALKAMFTSQPVLHLSDLSTPFAISTDTPKHASGGVLLQKTQMETDTLVPISPKPLGLQNTIMTSMTENCLWS